VEYRSPAPFFAFILAVVSGALLAFGDYVAGGVLAGLAITVLALWQFAKERGDDDRHTFW
jgi:hypothetical protein